MPLDYENLTQYKTPFNCPECGEHVFQTDAVLRSAFDFIEAECTNCGYALTREAISSQMKTIAPADMASTVAQSRV
jgi:transcription elongation factor Elf1